MRQGAKASAESDGARRLQTRAMEREGFSREPWSAKALAERDSELVGNRLLAHNRFSMRRGDYGYDAPYALIMFGALSAAGGLGAVNVQRRRLGWRFWWGHPIAATTLVTASKAADAVPDTSALTPM